MPRNRYTAREIRAILREAQILLDEGKSVREVTTQLGISSQTFYRWRENLVTNKVTPPSEPHFFGVYPAVVIDDTDPEGSGRVRIEPHPGLGIDDSIMEPWARLALLTSNDQSGIWFRPEVGDEVLIAFEAGKLNAPFVVGFLWNGQDMHPESVVDHFQIKSRSGFRIMLNDENHEESLTLETPAGQRVALNDINQTINISDSSGNTILVEPSGITISSAVKVSVNAAQVDISTGILNVNAGLSRFGGVLQADTVITNSVVSSSYTPGIGNVQ